MSSKITFLHDFLSKYYKCIEKNVTNFQVIGGGKIANVLVNAIINFDCCKKDNLLIVSKTEKTTKKWQNLKYPAITEENFFDKVQPSGIVLICVKPQVFLSEVAEKIKNWIKKNLSTKVVFMSVMAGITTKTLFKTLQVKVVRLMPNLACITSDGILLVAQPTSACETEQKHIEFAESFGKVIAHCECVPEKIFNCASAIAGSGPAFLHIVIEALADGGVFCGLSREISHRLAAQILKGTGELALTSKEFSNIKNDVCSPSGTSIVGVRQLEHAGVRSAFIEAVIASTQKATELEFS